MSVKNRNPYLKKLLVKPRNVVVRFSDGTYNSYKATIYSTSSHDTDIAKLSNGIKIKVRANQGTYISASRFPTSRIPDLPEPFEPVVDPNEDKPKPIIIPIRYRRNRTTSGSKKPGKGGASTGVRVSDEVKFVIAGKGLLKH